MGVRVRVFFALAALSLLGAGCGDLRRVRECRALAQAVNDALDDIETAVEPRSAAGYLDAARRYKELVGEVEALPLSAPGGQEARQAYLEVMRLVPPAVEGYAANPERKRIGDPAKDLRELERLSRRERNAASKLNAYCRAH